MVHALRSRRVVTPEGERDVAVLIEDEHIAAVLPPEKLKASVCVEDLGHLALLPGLVDAHTHINEPGRTEWEGFRTASRAAAAGGFTTLVDMPLNCLPETTNVHALEQKRAAARGQSVVDFALWGGAVNGNQGDLLPLAAAGVAGFKSFLIYPGCDGFTEIDWADLEAAVPAIARSGLPLLVHAELAAPIDKAFTQLESNGADWRAYATYLASRPDEAELQAISALLALCRQHPFRLHVVHLSTAAAVPMLRQARQEGVQVTVETCPHYLHFTAEEIPDGATLYKCAPPIRSAANREALWAGLADGTIDLIATDHSPCPPEMKRLHGGPPGTEPGRFDEAWGGIASLSVALPAIWTDCRQRGLPLSQVAEWMSAAPARLAGIADRAGGIAPGMQASLVAFDPDSSFEVRPESLHHRHPISPYLEERLHGVVRATWVRGRCVFRDGSFPGTPHGREHARMKAPPRAQENNAS